VHLPAAVGALHENRSGRRWMRPFFWRSNMKFNARLVLLTRAVEQSGVVNLHFRPEGENLLPQMVIPVSPLDAYALKFGALYRFEAIEVEEALPSEAAAG